MVALTASGKRKAVAWTVAALGAVTVAIYFCLPSTDAQNILYVTIGLVSTGLMICGLRINRPAERLGWWFLIVANVASTLGDAIENVLYGMILHRTVPFPSVADVFYLAAYPFIFLGIVRVCRTRRQGGSRESYADATIIAVAAMALSWRFVMGAYVHAADMSLFGKLVILAYPMMDIGLLFIMLRAVVFGSIGVTSHRIIAAALSCTLIADSAYDYMVQHNLYGTGSIIDAGWLLNYVLMAVAVLHPSVAEIPRVRVSDPTSRRRLPLLTGAGFVAPIILLVSALTGSRVDTPVIAGTSIALFSLVSLRMSWLLSNLRAHTLRARADADALAEALRTREKLESDLRYQANHDPLTGLANRALLFERAGYALEEAGASGQRVALCLCDLDGFKTINDSLGHDSGDELLLVIASRLQSLVRGSDTVARLGGDEFAVLLDRVTTEEQALQIADRIVMALRDPVTVNGRQIAVSVSVGLTFATQQKTTEQLLGEADVAMYEAKTRGKSRCEVFETSMSARSLERLELANALRGSLQRGDFHLDYQPYFSLVDGRLQGFESLLRWDHPTAGLVSPDRFVPLAEETGFIVPLGRWVLETACHQAAEWVQAGASDIVLAVNISGKQLQDKSFPSDLLTTLAISGLPARNLMLEVTESSVIDDTEEMAALLNALKETGVQIALDDFGTGYSALSYLRRLPFDVLKIDKSFVDPLIDGTAHEEALVATIIDFAGVLGLRTVAEGVEHERQRAILSRLGCSTAQGFLLSRPLDQAAVWRLIAEQGTLSERSLVAGDGR